MPWLLRFPELDDRINARADLQALRRDEYVREVRWEQDPATHIVEVHVEFHESYDAPRDQELRRRLGPYIVLHEAPLDLEPIPRVPRNQTMVEGFRLNYGLDHPPTLDNETRQRIIERYLASTSGREQLARAMVAPIRQRMDYQSIARRTFLVEQMPEGALPVYGRDPNVPEMVTPGHDTDYLALPGHLPLHATKHYVKPEELPPWVAVGCWVRDLKGRTGMVVNHYRTEDRGRREHTHIIIGIWRTQDSVDLCAHHVVVGWEPCRQPPEPLSVWERILGDDFVDD